MIDYFCAHDAVEQDKVDEPQFFAKSILEISIECQRRVKTER